MALVIAFWTMRNIPLDALPDLSDTQVIVYSRWDRSPDIIEDQVTYPIVTALLGAPKVKAIRGFSDFGFSYVYVIFEDGTDIYWARTRVAGIPLQDHRRSCPQGVKTESARTPPAWAGSTSTPWWTAPASTAWTSCAVYQDWFLRYALQSVPGVAEVATVGGGPAVPGDRQP